MARALTLLLAALAAAAAAQDDDFGFHISDAEYYTMPKLFALDEYRGCVARGLGYCVGSFDLSPRGAEAGQMFQLMQRYSANWVDRFNHTRLHRGVCLARRCPRPGPPGTAGGRLEDWFADCVNATTMAEYNMSATLTALEYCRGGEEGAGGAGEEHRAPLGASERAAAALAAALLALAAVSTGLDLTLPDHNRKGMQWALSWSVVGCWRALLAAPPVSKESDLRMFDGVRVICMFCVIIEHVCWLATLSYSSDPRYTEEKRRETDVMLMTNSTLVVQIFFMMSTFLLAHKLLRARRRAALPLWGTFANTMLNRIIRISPTYWAVVWFAASWWARLGSGPLWTPLVGAEAAVCRHKWWTHLLYLNNVVYPDDKCLIQTWYLAADMQVYVLCLGLTLLLTRGGRAARALPLLGGCLALSLAVLAALAYAWRLVPTFVMHRPECIRRAYHGEASFNVLYQSPLGNVPGALAGLILAHTHHLLLDRGFKADKHPWFRWSSLAAFPLAVLWAALSPRLLGAGPPPRAAAAALAVLERPVFALGMGLAMLGALHGVRSPWRSGLSWAGWAPLARLSFAALLLHMPINKSVVASRLQPKQLDRFTAVFEWCGVAAISYLAAVPLALLVEIPAQRLHAALTRARTAPRVQPEPNNNTVEKTQHT